MPPNHIMYPYFEYGEAPGYVRVKRVPGGLEVLGRIFPKEEAASGALPLRLAKILGAVPNSSPTFSEAVPNSTGAVPKFDPIHLATSAPRRLCASKYVPAASTTEFSEPVPKFVFAMAGTVPRCIIDKFIEVFGFGAVFVGELAEPRALMENYVRLNPPPHWWPKSGTSPGKLGTASGEMASERLGTAYGKSGSATLRTITARQGAGRFAVAVRSDGKGGFFAECGMWSPAKRRVLNADEELSAMKCRFSEANPGATVMQKRIFADVAARHVVYRVCDFKSIGGFMSGNEGIMVFAPDLAASSVARDALSFYGPTRVFMGDQWGQLM